MRLRANEREWSGAAYRLEMPTLLESAAVFSSPHSGRRYPPGFVARSRLSPLALRSSEDAFVDELFDFAPKLGAPLLAAEFPRAYVDANRSEGELDPALIAHLSSPKNRSLRVTAGLGVVPRVVAEGAPIYPGRLSMEEVQARITGCYRPFHTALGALLDGAVAQFGLGLLIDCHSMPPSSAKFSSPQAQIVIGDCFGSSCDSAITDAVVEIFRHAGFRVARNVPFAGGFITQHYGAPERNRHALQIEIDRTLYLDHARVEKSDSFPALKSAMDEIVRDIIGITEPYSRKIAAE